MSARAVLAKVVLISNHRAIASAVIIPEEAEEQLNSPPISAKRRQSSVSEQDVKRPRLSHQDVNDVRSPASDATNRAMERRKTGLTEERKRGKRLFGALLGTLSQSSSSTAQKRRTDIERKQQAKLKSQADEFDEKKKNRRKKSLISGGGSSASMTSNRYAGRKPGAESLLEG